MFHISLLRKTVLATSLGFGLALTGCGSSEVEKAEEKAEVAKKEAQEIRQALHVNDTADVKVPDRSAFRPVDEKFLMLYEVKKVFDKIQDTDNLGGENKFPLNELSMRGEFEDRDVFMEENNVIKMEKARVSLLPKVKEAIKDIKEVEYIKVPLTNDYKAYTGLWSGFSNLRNNRTNPEQKMDFDFNLDETLEDGESLASGQKTYYMQTFDASKEQIMALSRLDRNSIKVSGDTYWIVQRNQRGDTNIKPAYIDYVISNLEGDVLYQGKADIPLEAD